jgi:hypothetical protein
MQSAIHFYSYSESEVASSTTFANLFVSGKSSMPATIAATALMPKNTALLSN